MRTTVTLDPDVAVKLRAIARERRLSFKEVLNTSIRLGLADAAATAQPLRIEARPLGLRKDVNLDKALQLAGELEDVELARKLELRK